MRYAAKEAVVKALNGIGKINMDYNKIEIYNNEKGVPMVRIRDYNKLHVHISLSHCKDKAIAFAIAIKQ